MFGCFSDQNQRRVYSENETEIRGKVITIWRINPEKRKSALRKNHAQASQSGMTKKRGDEEE
jgi:hypothetical protein